MTSTEIVTYTDSLMERLVSSTVPTSDTVATATVLDGFTIEQSDHQGGSWSFTRQFLSTGIIITQTDPRGITTSTQTDIAGRPIIQSDGEGNQTTTTYTACCNNPASITDALGNTINYKYKAPEGMEGDWRNLRSNVCPQGESPMGWGRVNYRHYNPTNGRWINRDPIAEEGGLNLYGFVENKVRGIDVLGYEPIYIEDFGLTKEDFLNAKAQFDELEQLRFEIFYDENCKMVCEPQQGHTAIAETRLHNDCCQYRKKTDSNGCGSHWFQQALQIIIVPDIFILFSSACDKHDLCYSECGSNKSSCDTEFWNEMNKVTQKYWWLLPFYAKALAMRNTYYSIVRDYGKTPFENAQKESCTWHKCKK